MSSCLFPCPCGVQHDDENVVVTYHNPLDNVKDLAHHFFQRCLEAKIVPYVVTKKTVFKWQEGFWTIMKVTYPTIPYPGLPTTTRIT